MRVCIVGAGLAGLCAAKHSIHNGMEVTVFEQGNQIGGTWVYTDNIGEDDHGIAIHSSMYKGLRTNLPKEIMGFPDFPFPEQTNSYIDAEDVLEFINLYASKFDLLESIKLKHYVLRILPKNNSWEVIVKDLSNNQFVTYTFDCVLVCSGHFQLPSKLQMPGHELFRGKQLHSHDYRRSEVFSDQKILIVGSGPSALDLILQLNGTVEELTISHHLSAKINLPEHVVQKPDILRIHENHVEFIDNTIQIVDVIIYCTGYNYSFPFLSMDSGIYIENNYVQPLYKQCINIKNPTLAFIGLINEAALSHVIDLQVRFVLSYFLGKNQLPSKPDMYADTDLMKKYLIGKGIPENKLHYLGSELQEKYCDDLSTTGNIENVKPVILKLYHIASCKVFLENLMNFRDIKFKLINDEKFVKLN